MDNSKYAVAIITARGGSRRIPGKNIRIFCGKPILAYSIEAALESGVFQEVMVSTDSDEIADIAKKYGAQVPFRRSEKTAGDFATTDEVIAEVLETYEKQGRPFERFCCIYPTAPFITAARLREAMKLLDEHESVLPVVKFSYPPQRGFVIRTAGESVQDGIHSGNKHSKRGDSGDEYSGNNGTDAIGRVTRWMPQYETARSQDLEPVYHDAGQFYACRTDAFFRGRTTDVEDMVPLILPETEVQDIDTQSDWEIAEQKYIALHRNV